MKSWFTAMLPRRPKRSAHLDRLSRSIEIRGQRHWAVICEVDFLKPYTDIYGEAAGKEMLGIVGETLTRGCRGEDQVFRRGDRELIMIVTAESLEQARACADRHRVAIEQLQIPNQGSPFGVVTVSMGLATIGGGRGDAAAEALEEADAALVRAKRAGRNQVASAVTLVAA
jgi:diguanylate cyclase (GGDEF)-like protein